MHDPFLHLRAWRIAKGMSQGVLAQHSGLRQASISRMEAGKIFPRGRCLARLATALNIAPQDLLSLPPQAAPRGLPRHKADRLAKAIVSGKYPKDKASHDFCLRFALWVGEKLRAQSAPGWKKISRSHIHSPNRPVWMKRTYSKPVLDQMLWRIHKALALVRHSVP